MRSFRVVQVPYKTVKVLLVSSKKVKISMPIKLDMNFVISDSRFYDKTFVLSIGKFPNVAVNSVKCSRFEMIVLN